MSNNNVSITRITRIIHRDLGYFVVGIALVYALSGIVLIYRDTDFLKSENQIEKVISKDLKIDELGKALRIKDIKVTQTEGNIIYFEKGHYDASTGKVIYTSKELPKIISKMTDFHKSSTKNWVHWISLMFAIILLFMSVSSFFMFKKENKLFKRGLIISLAGFVFIILLMSL